jgi:predicted RNase H-like HicB family nuclease
MAPTERLQVDDYLDRPYQIALVRRDGEDGPVWCAQVEELQGCEAQGSTPEEAAAGLRAEMSAWIAGALEEGRPVPKPRAAVAHSGRLLVRMPPTLHAELARLSDRERVSLNALIIAILSGAVAWRQPAGRAADALRPARRVDRDVDPAPAGQTSGAAPRADRSGLLSVAVWTNLVVVAIAGITAIGLLIAALAG